jgi:putative aldouronate transport system permease protein
MVNQIITALGGNAINFMGNVNYFRSIYVWTGVWQSMGYSAIVYLAALTGVPQDLYEAARVDGASKLRRIISIDLPYIAPTIITLFVLNTGSILSVGFEKVYLMQNSINTPVSEVISTYVYKMGVLQFNYSYSTAVGLFNSVVNLAMLLVVNTISNRISKISVL